MSSTDLNEGLNLNVSVESTSGHFLLRVYHQWMTEERIAFLHTVKHTLLDVGVLVPRPIGWVRSSHLGLDIDRIVELECFVAHQKVQYSWDFHECVFPVLGKLHDALGNTIEDRGLVPPSYHNYALPSELLQRLDVTEGTIRRLGLDEGEEVAEALRVCSRTRDILREMDRWWWETGAKLPRQLVHGDFNTGTNVLIDNHQSISVLDFDFVDFHERIFDITYSMFFATGSLEYGKPVSERDWQRINKSVRLYEQTFGRTLAESEWESLPLEMARVPLFWVAEAGYFVNPHKRVLEDRQAVEDSYWIMEHLGVLTGRLR